MSDKSGPTVSAPLVPVLLLTGPIGVGKTTVLREADALLVAAGVRHASAELEEVARFWGPELDRPGRARLVSGNLAALWAGYAAAGADRLLLSALVEGRSDLDRVAAAVPGAKITVVRLDAPPSVLEERLRRRESDPEDEIAGARWWSAHLDRLRPEDHLVPTDGRTPREVARQVLAVAGWPT